MLARKDRDVTLEKAKARLERHRPVLRARLARTMKIDPVDDSGRMAGRAVKSRKPVCA